MKKKGWIVFGCIFAVALLAGAVTYVQGQKNREQEEEESVQGQYINEPDEEEEEEFDIQADINARMVEREEGDVIWTISDDVSINEKYLKLLNKKLKQDGYDFQLKFQYLDEEHYNEEVREVLECGDTDIALGGQDNGYYENVVAKVCRDGLFMELSTYLESEEYGALWEEYEEPLWKSVSVDEKIYTIPNGIYDDGRFCVVFNNQYIDKKESEKFTGDVTELGVFLTDELKESSEGKKLLFTWNCSDAANVLGYYEQFGAFFETETGKISSPFEFDRVKEFMEMLNMYQKAGCVPEECSLRADSANEKIKEMIKNKEFSILLTKRSDTIEAIKDDVTMVDLDFSPSFARISGTNGICARSENAKAAMQLFTLLHTQDEYAHLLLYGEEGKDYKIEEGRIVSDDYTGIGTVDILGIYRSSYPDEEELIYNGNIRQQKREIYRSSHCITSAVAGFQIDETAFTEEELADADTAESYFDVWKEEDFEKKYEKAKKNTAEAEEVIFQKLEEQLKTWKKNIK